MRAPLSTIVSETVVPPRVSPELRSVAKVTEPPLVRSSDAVTPTCA